MTVVLDNIVNQRGAIVQRSICGLRAIVLLGQASSGETIVNEVFKAATPGGVKCWCDV